MGLFDVFGKDKKLIQAKNHIHNLIEMARADGRFDICEYELILTIAKKYGIADEEMRAIHQEGGQRLNALPSSMKERFQQFYEIVQIMQADGRVDESELLLCQTIFKNYGFNQGAFTAVMEQVESGLFSGSDVDVVYKKLSPILQESA